MPRHGQRVWPWLLGGLTLGVDQVTKHVVATAFSPNESLPLLAPILHLTYVQNTGAAFGLFKGQQGLFILLSALIILWIAWELLARPSDAPRMWIGCALILGGAAGNLIDRARLGFVIDFIDLRVWPVFNIADSAITVGLGLLLWQSMRSQPTRRS